LNLVSLHAALALLLPLIVTILGYFGTRRAITRRYMTGALRTTNHLDAARMIKLAFNEFEERN
jgi:hypothetical protein